MCPRRRCQSGPHRSRRGPAGGKRSCNPGDCVFAIGIHFLVALGLLLYQLYSPARAPAHALDRERRGAKGSLDDAHRLMMRIGVLLGFVTAAAGFRGLLPAVGPHVDWSCSRARANQGRCTHFGISPVMANTCLPTSSSRLMIHRHSSVASRPRNARGMLRRASGRAERDGARGEASTHSVSGT